MDSDKRIDKEKLNINRRHFYAKASVGLGTVALGSLMIPGLFSGRKGAQIAEGPILGAPHFAPKAKRIIYLFQAGAPSQFETFDYKPLLNERMGALKAAPPKSAEENNVTQDKPEGSAADVFQVGEMGHTEETKKGDEHHTILDVTKSHILNLFTKKKTEIMAEKPMLAASVAKSRTALLKSKKTDEGLEK